ncbi:protein NETWORKED 3A [Ricinus communis]|uniref:NAB domain-containing protein n=1 Tax=Ricinus communis TaxID=3988 RepID=B9RGZ9_RICCO|nr:protein NETWORKED 3A [Ricinus communis]EEF49361.1 conserved hypothetical protein [Ricinus communis]|eukprot:XP_002512858.1 protein NETWORKED 3A [Ricinus communis]
MGNNGSPFSSSSLAADNHNSIQQSQWLRATLSDMNKRMRAIMTLLAEDENSSAKTKNYDNRRLELFQMLEHFNNSYCSLAEKYDRLRSKLCHVTDSGLIPSSSNANNKTRLVGGLDDPKPELSVSCLDSILSDADVDCDNEKAIDLCDKKGINKINYNNLVRDQSIDADVLKASSEQGNSSEHGGTWFELKFQVTNLMEENLRQQAELARRNIEKKLIINRLQLQLEHLKGENKDLQSCISCLKAVDKDKQFQMSKLRRMFSGSS